MKLSHKKTHVPFIFGNNKKLKESFSDLIINNEKQLLNSGTLLSKHAWKLLADNDFLRFPISKSDGGLGESFETMLPVINTINYYMESGDLILNALFQISGLQLIFALHGSSSQKNQYLLNLINGNQYGAHCLTEPHSGTDCSSMKTTATEKNDCWEISGEKIYISNGYLSDFAIVYAKTNSTNADSISCFIIDLNNKNIIKHKPIKKIGLSTLPLSRIVFNKVRIPKNNVLGCINSGMGLLHMTTTFERIIIPSAFIGRMAAIYDRCYQIMKKTNTFQFESMLSEMYSKLLSSFTLQEYAFRELDRKKWSRDLISLGCVVKTTQSKNYIDFVKKAKKLLSYYNNISEDDINFINSELSDAISSWIYSGANDALNSMLIKLI